jgi:hypothetical protein
VATGEQSDADLNAPTTRIVPGQAADLDPPTARIDPVTPTPDVTPAPAPIVPSLPVTPPVRVSLAFEEYKLYYESAERVTERRLDLNKWNYSVMVATLLAIGAVLTWAAQRPNHAVVGGAGVVMLSLMAYLHCSFWTRQIDDFKALNTAKFKVLDEMAPYVRFPESDEGEELRSYEPFRREWESMQRNHAVHEIHRTGFGRMIALKSSTAEYFMAQVFRWAFLLVALGTIVLVLTTRNLSGNISPFNDVK